MTDQGKLVGSVEFAMNPEPRCACLLLLDTSGSMSGAPIDALNAGIAAFQSAIGADPVASKRVEVAVMTFADEVRLINDFCTIDRFTPPTLEAHGSTKMGAAIHAGLDLLARRKDEYRANGVAYYRPWVMMITDGEPVGETDADIIAAADRVRGEETGKRVAFFAVGVGGANMTKLAEMVTRVPLKLTGLHFAELFVWLSTSLSQVSHSRTDEQVALPPPTGWAQV